MSGISLSGLSSGIDFTALRQALMNSERAAGKRFTTKQDKFKLERTAFTDVNTRLGSLISKMSPILATGTANLFSKVSATSSNTGVLTATSGTSAVAGTYDIRVKNLALADSVISKTAATVTPFTSSVTGTDLNPNIDPTTTLVSSLHRRDNAASFVAGDLGQLVISDGVTPVTVDLSVGLTTGSTFQQTLDYINTSLAAGGSAITASLNATGNGILFSGTPNISIADGADAKTTATKLGVKTIGLVPGPINGGDLNPDLQGNTPLSKLNGGVGVADLLSGITIRNGSSSVNVALSTATTVDNVIAAINAAGISATAAINGTKNGLAVTSTVSNKSLAIEEKGGTTAANLGIFGDSNVLRVKSAADVSYFKVYLDGARDAVPGDLSLADIRDSINAVSGRTFGASVVDGRLQVQTNLLGIANKLQLKDNAPANGIFEQLGILITDAVDDTTISTAFALDNTKGGYLQSAKDATFSVNGLTVTRSKNTAITDVITDVTLNLVAPSTSTGPAFPTDYASTTLSIAKDTTSMATSIADFVDQYNSVINFLSTSTHIDPKGPGGVLASSSLARTLKDNLFNTISQRNPVIAGQTNRSIFDLKDSTGAFVFKASVRDGEIELNKTALTNVLNANPTPVSDVFRYASTPGGTFDGGVVYNLNKLAANYNASPSGVIPAQVKTYDSEITNLDKQIAQFNERLDKRDAALKRQFGTAEKLISMMQSQSNNLSSQLGGFTKK